MATRTRFGNSRNSRKVQSSSTVSTHSRYKECKSTAIESQQNAAVRVETATQVLRDGARNVGPPKAKCLRNESEYTSTSVLEPESRPTSRSDQCMEPTMDENRLIFAPTLETGTKRTMETEDRQRQESCVNHTELAKLVLEVGDSETEFNPTNGFQGLQTMILDCMAVIRWYQAKEQNPTSVTMDYL